MQAIGAVIGQQMSNGQARNQGQSTGFLGGPGAIDGTAQSFYNFLDPANFSGKASSGHVLSNFFDPGNVFGMNQAANPYGPGGVGSGSGMTLPPPNGNVNPQFYNPNSFGGLANLGPGQFNAEAAQMAGPMYVPSLIKNQKSGGGTSKGGGYMGNGFGAVSGNGGSGSVGSPFLSLSFGPTTWTGAPIAWGGNMYGWGNNGQVSSAFVPAQGGGMTNATEFQSMTKAGRAQR